MTDEELHDLAAAYAVDAVDDAERTAFAAHLPSCVPCQQVVAELSDVAVSLSDGLQVDPPPGLRDRVLRQVAIEATASGQAEVSSGQAGGEEPVQDTDRDGDPREQVVPFDSARRRRGQQGGARNWLVAAAAVVVVGMGAWGVSQTLTPDGIDQVASAEDASEHTTPDAPGLTVITSASADRAVLRLPTDLTAPPAGSVYQAWFIDADGDVRSAGVLSDTALEDRSGLLEGAVSGATAVALSLEPQGGSEQPTTDPFAVVPLG